MKLDWNIIFCKAITFNEGYEKCFIYVSTAMLS